ncbi:unnamed protein product, partial [Prorocentrum cordatum]
GSLDTVAGARFGLGAAAGAHAERPPEAGGAPAARALQSVPAWAAWCAIPVSGGLLGAVLGAGAAARRRRSGRPAGRPAGRPDPDLRRIETTKAKVFLDFRPLAALAGPRDRQKTTQDEKPVLGNGSRLPGTQH